MSKSHTFRPISDNQIAFIRALANEVRQHLSKDEVANLKAKLADPTLLTFQWGSSAIEKLIRIRTKASLELVKAARIKSSSED